MNHPMLAAAIATQVAKTMLDGKPIPYITAYEKCHEVAAKVYEVMHAENQRLHDERDRLCAVCRESLAALELEHRELQQRIDQWQDEWNHRHWDDINVPNDCAMWCGVEIEEPPILAALRAAIASATTGEM